jgi:hypothetical protein
MPWPSPSPASACPSVALLLLAAAGLLARAAVDGALGVVIIVLKALLH